MSAPRAGSCVAPTASLYVVLKRGKPLVFAGNQNTIYVSFTPWSIHSTMLDFRYPLDH